MLKKSFVSFLFDVDTNDIQKFIYIEFKICPLTIIKTKMIKIIRRFKIDKTRNFDDNSNKILQFFFEKLIKMLTPLYQKCVNKKYYSLTFKKINTIIFKKLNKKNYIISKIYKSITLLNTLNKTLKFIMKKKITYLAKQYKFFFDTHMNVRRDKLIESMLKLLTKQIHIVLNRNIDKITTLLNINVFETFNTISYFKLFYNLRKKNFTINRNVN